MLSHCGRVGLSDYVQKPFWIVREALQHILQTIKRSGKTRHPGHVLGIWTRPQERRQAGLQGLVGKRFVYML